MPLDLHQDEHIQLWQHADIQMVSIQRHTLAAGAKAFSFSFPSNGFLCTSIGSALMLFDNQIYSAHGMQVFHAAAKSWVELNAGKDGLDFSLVLYEASVSRAAPAKFEAPVHSRKHSFHMPYSFTPAQPTLLYDILEQMHDLSRQQHAMAQFQLKAQFYQWIYQVVKQYHSQSPAPRTTSPVELVTEALEYMLDHYAEPLTLESLASALNCSQGHLSNRFKQVLNRGPIDCLIRLRMEKARKLLAETAISLKTVATAVGYQDVYYFSHAFKKHFGLPPSLLRKQLAANENLTSAAGRNHIVAPDGTCYFDNDNYYQNNDGGSSHMFINKMMVPASLLLAFGLLLGACGSNPTESATGNKGGSATAASQPAATAENDTKPATRIVSTSMGDVEIPAHPERVVTDFYMGYLLALDIKPVGSNGIFMKNPYLEDQIAGIVDVGDSLEAILELKPDLIITGDAKKYEAYSKIAPTIMFPKASDLRDELKQLGIMLNKEAKADSLVQDLDKQVESTKKRIDHIVGKDKTVTVFDGGAVKTLILYGNAFTGRTIHGELGLPMNENVKRDIDPKVGWLQISSEVIGKYASDYIFMAVDAKAESFDYANDPIWNTLDAVKQNHLYEIDGYRFYFSDPISVMGQLEDIADMMEERERASVKRG